LTEIYKLRYKTKKYCLLKQGEEAKFLDYKTVEDEIITKESIYR